MVHLRSIFNKAVQKKVADFKKNPFKNSYTNHTNPYGYDFSRLKKSKISQRRKDRIKDLRNGRWFYQRSKTGTGLKYGKPLLPEALAIIEKYDTKEEYIFEILNGYDQDEKTKTDRVRRYLS